MDTLKSLRVFRQVVESGSFVGAAECMDLSTAMVSKHVMHIERRLGARLLNRNSRALSLTEPGSVYYERCRSMLDELDATEAELASLGRCPRGTLRIRCPSWFAGRLLAGMLVAFRSRHPEIVVDVTVGDGTADLVEEGCDISLCVAPDMTSLSADVVARPIRSITLYVVASKQYLEAHGTPETPEDLAKHDCVAAGNMTSWVFHGPKHTADVPARVVARYRSTAGAASAAAAGLGLTALPAMFLEDPSFHEGLVPVLPEFPMQQATMFAAYTSRKFVPLKIRAFVDFALEWSAACPGTRAGATIGTKRPASESKVLEIKTLTARPTMLPSRERRIVERGDLQQVAV